MRYGMLYRSLMKCTWATAISKFFYCYYRHMFSLSLFLWALWLSSEMTGCGKILLDSTPKNTCTIVLWTYYHTHIYICLLCGSKTRAHRFVCGKYSRTRTHAIIMIIIAIFGSVMYDRSRRREKHNVNSKIIQIGRLNDNSHSQSSSSIQHRRM